MSVIGALRHGFQNLARAVQLLAEIRDGIANLTTVTDRRLKGVEAALAETQRLLQDQTRSDAPAQNAGPVSPTTRPGGRFFPS